ncbi:MAG: twin-arginine translocase TatA/TatE family subunit [Nitrospiraceae bacterium]|nr:MAG: twin-arginine translocase TatA/TatE family subunit [Nitrospiraceae bacterium]
MFDLGMQELIVIFIVAFLVFGPKRLPELGRTLGKGMRELKAAMRNVKNSLDESDLNISKEINEAKADLGKSFKDAVGPDLNISNDIKEAKADLEKSFKNAIEPDIDTKTDAGNKEPSGKAESQAGGPQANIVEEKKIKTEAENDG